MALQFKVLVGNVNQNHTRPADLIGQVNVTAKVATTVYGIGLLFEGKASSTLISKKESLLKVRRSCNYFVLKPLEIRKGRFQPVESYNEALPTDQVIEWTFKKVKLQPGLNSFPYCITFNPDQVLPTAFKHELGSIQYKLAAYIKKDREGKFLRVVDTNVNVVTYSHCPTFHLSHPVSVTKSRTGSGRKFIEGTLTLRSGVFLPGTEINFKLTVVNRSAGRIQVISLNLIRNLAFHAANFSKSEFTHICTNELQSSCSLLGQDTFEWEGNLAIPMDSMLSFQTNHKCLEVFYFVQFTVGLIGNGSVQGEIPVQVVSRLASCSPEDGASQSQLSDIIHVHQSSSRESIPPPPSYSEAMRYSASLETLPPAYEDLS
ncbi:unnamed protein product [Allacma fusca]|uniref:Arrestin C-terminal-like domain-containing protein n=1 Tax=Allacma fusca TaxID=39272 RepID=A0A8J2J833_9HEXA|nr:unnamed protein product [Allacma fusca]